ncbi:ABC transporter domain-containing protein [Ditylenchus destructor]|uniref:ABC transporter domain-containing protein n=1 Tax=Ditylenchus destructor TaxID=166010 RepID=A0AAD4QUZ7_9BILA|nr:ABC transporter domain-containing protein [Ditylenchus destructor]
MSPNHDRARGRADYIRIEGVSKHFGDGGEGVLALKDIDCSIEQGSFVTIVGPSGCGKSTLLRILAGLLDYGIGRVLLDGQPIHGTRRDVGVVFQSSILLPWRTILENVMLPAEVLAFPQSRRASGRCSCCRWSGSKVSSTSCRASSAAACSSAPPSRGRCCTTPRSC